MSHPRRARVVVVSDGVAAGQREDRSGARLIEVLTAEGFVVDPPVVCPDGVESVSATLRRCTEEFDGVVVTTGGTGFGPRDLTPEATALVLEREAPGLAEAIRGADRLGRLSRGRCGTVGQALVINLPGSTKGVVSGWSAVSDVVGHALDLMAGRPTDHPH